MARFIGSGLLAVGVAVATLIVVLPKSTHADDSNAVEDWERQGEYVADEDGKFLGSKFGDVLVKGELKSTESGWVLVRSFENTSDEPRTLTVEERVSSVMTARFARVTPPATTLILRTQRVALKAHEKKSIGVSLPPEMSKEIDESRRITRAIAREEKLDETGADQPNWAFLNRTYKDFEVAYLTPLPPGKHAARSQARSLMPAPLPPPPSKLTKADSPLAEDLAVVF
jgi:hypothetical protein